MTVELPKVWTGPPGAFPFGSASVSRAKDLSRGDRDAVSAHASSPAIRTGIIFNALARHNFSRESPVLNGSGWAMPRDHGELHEALAGFAARDVNVLVIDGGDGTIRDVMTAAARHFTRSFPRLAVIPSGKTNALASDLGIPRHWTIQSALNAALSGQVVHRAPIEVSRPGSGEDPMLGFIFGSGAFARATALAQKTHSFGAFNGLAVGLSIAGGIAQTWLGGRNNVWRRGDMMGFDNAQGVRVDQRHYIMLASTLMHLPTGIRPFGRLRDGLKILRVDAPPRKMLFSLPWLLMGSEAPFLERAGYNRTDVDRLRLSLTSDFILDGEAFSGGDIELRRRAPIGFVVP
jgi:Diacylglycerol kinase catalytic domain